MIDKSFMIDDEEKARRNREMVANAHKAKGYTNSGYDNQWLKAGLALDGSLIKDPEIVNNRVLSINGYDYLVEGGEKDG
jgi:hypothetical protein